MAYKQRTGMAAATPSILTDDPDFLRLIVERVIQEVLEAEMTAHLHAEAYERSAARSGYRNGYKPRQLNTRVGTLTLQVPQDRDGTFSTQLFPATTSTRKRWYSPSWRCTSREFRPARCARSPRCCVGRVSRRASSRSWRGSWMQSWRHGGTAR